jgi:hypothetical protein
MAEDEPTKRRRVTTEFQRTKKAVKQGPKPRGNDIMRRNLEARAQELSELPNVRLRDKAALDAKRQRAADAADAADAAAAAAASAAPAAAAAAADGVPEPAKPTRGRKKTSDAELNAALAAAAATPHRLLSEEHWAAFREALGSARVTDRERNRYIMLFDPERKIRGHKDFNKYGAYALRGSGEPDEPEVRPHVLKNPRFEKLERELA